MVDPRRIIHPPGEKAGTGRKGPVLYWMNRDQRASDNWALLFARQLAEERAEAMAVAYVLPESFVRRPERQLDFMLRGLREVEATLEGLDIPFFLLSGDPVTEIEAFVRQYKTGALVCDFDPLRESRAWRAEVIGNCDVPVYTVDAHNVVPAFFVSSKQEFAASTFRPRINRVLESFLVPFPQHSEPGAKARKRNRKVFGTGSVDWTRARAWLNPDTAVGPADWLQPGEKAACAMMEEFIRVKLESYDSLRNDPNANAVSNLSPYLHFGHISAQRVALEVLREGSGNPGTSSFLEELIVRRELSDNYCLYNHRYDTLENIPDWAKATLEQHRRDEREHIYSLADFETAGTHEALWNAAQSELIRSGKMHGYMRMYWAKKILEWSRSPEEALEIAIYLNDRYQLDGSDPNGYTGCAWSIAGVHDRAWAERPVYGKVRYMNENGCRRKFDVDSYIRRWTAGSV